MHDTSPFNQNRRDNLPFQVFRSYWFHVEFFSKVAVLRHAPLTFFKVGLTGFLQRDFFPAFSGSCVDVLGMVPTV